MEKFMGVKCRRVGAEVLRKVGMILPAFSAGEVEVIQADIEDVIEAKKFRESSVRGVALRMLLPKDGEKTVVIDADEEEDEFGLSDSRFVELFAEGSGAESPGNKIIFCRIADSLSRKLRAAGIAAHEFRWRAAHEFRWSGKAQQPGSFAEEENRKEEAEESEETFIDIGCGDFVEKGKFDMRTILLDQIKFFRELQKKAAEDDPSDAAAIIKYSDHIIYLFDDLIERIEDE